MTENFSTRELAAQCIMPRLNIENFLTDENYRERIFSFVEQGIGGFCIFTGSMQQAADVIAQLQQKAKIPLLFSGDFEWGTAMRLEDGTAFPYAMALGQNKILKNTYLVAQAIAREAKAIGVHWNFAPVCDVNSNPENPIISIRAFGDEPETVAAHAAAYIDGTQKEKILACAKHFPGHGDTSVDSHLQLPLLPFKRKRFDDVEFVPFREAISRGVKSVMVGHLEVPGLDEGSGLPASLNPVVVTKILREEFSFDGIVVTDALDMHAIADNYSNAQVGVLALKAGIDVILLPENPEECLNGLEKFLSENSEWLEKAKISAERILDAKKWCGLFEREKFSLDEKTINEHRTLALKAAQAGIKFSGEKNFIPLDKYKQIAGFCYISGEDIQPGVDFFQYLAQLVEVNSDFGFFDENISEQDLTEFQDATKDADIFVFALFSKVRAYEGRVGLPEKLFDVAKKLSQGKPTIAVILGHPDPKNFSADCTIFTFSDSLPSIGAAALALAGRV